MPLIRTDKGLQYFADSPPPEYLATPAPASARRLLLPRAKALLPLLPLLFSAVSWLCVKYTTSDRMQQQAADDHAAIAGMKEQMISLKTETSTLNAKLDLLLRLNLKENAK